MHFHRQSRFVLPSVEGDFAADKSLDFVHPMEDGLQVHSFSILRWINVVILHLCVGIRILDFERLSLSLSSALFAFLPTDYSSEPEGKGWR